MKAIVETERCKKKEPGFPVMGHVFDAYNQMHYANPNMSGFLAQRNKTGVCAWPKWCRFNSLESRLEVGSITDLQYSPHEEELSCFMGKVYYRWCDFTSKRFMRDTNAFLSALNLTPLCSYVELCFTRELPCAIGFLTNIGKQIVHNRECAEVYFDSTYKTNYSKFKLFFYYGFSTWYRDSGTIYVLTARSSNILDTRYKRMHYGRVSQSRKGKIP